MSRYTNVKVNISERQREKLQHAIQTGGPGSIRFSNEDLYVRDILAQTQSQVNKMARACESGEEITV